MAWELADNIRGPRGDKGNPGTISSVSVATLPPGEAAKATLTGKTDVHVAFAIPKGDKGDQGVPGTLSSASAESVPAGAPAEVIMSGTTEVKHAHFKVPRGLSGTNAVENDAAFAEYVAAVDSDTRAALNANFASIESVAGRTAADGVTDDTAAIQAVIDLVASRPRGGVVYLPAKSYAITAPLILSNMVPIYLVAERGARLVARASMTAMVSKPSGPGTGFGIINLDLEGARLAERCVDLEAGLRGEIIGGTWQNATVAVADFSRGGAHLYELSWRDTRVVGNSSEVTTSKADYGIRTGSGFTDNVIDNVVVKNADVLVQDGGHMNTWEKVHVFSLRDNIATCGFRVLGHQNRFVNCYPDTQVVGFDLVGDRNSVINPMFFWIDWFTDRSDLVGVRVQGQQSLVSGGTFRLGYDPDLTGVAFEIGAGSGTKTIITDNRLYGLWSSFWTLLGSNAPNLGVNTWDHGDVPSEPLSAPSLDVTAAAGTAREVRFRSGGSNRWVERVSGNETGDGSGSNYELIGYKDDGTFLGTPLSALRASAVLQFGRGTIRARNLQTVSAAGGVTIDAAASSNHLVQLQANATSVTIANASAIPSSKPVYQGQELTVTVEQDATGGRTFAWPSSCRFAGNAAPTDTTANTRTSVTFTFSGSRWYEVSRAVAVPLS